MATLAAQKVNQRDLAEAVGVDPRTIRDLTDRGLLPRDKRSQLYPVGECLRALRSYWEGKATREAEDALDYNEERARLTHHQANRAQLRSEREAGKLIEEAAVRLALEHVLVPLRQQLLGLEVSLPPKLQGLDAPGLRQVLAREVRDILAALSRPELHYGGDTADPELDVLDHDPEEPEPGESDPPGIPVP